MTGSDQHVEIRTATEGDRVVVSVSGEIDAATAERFEADLLPATAGAASVALDLSEVTFMDSSGLRALVTVHGEVSGRGGTVELRAASSVVDRILSVTGLS